MTELPQATSRRELRERERAIELARSRPQPGRRDRPSRAKAVEKARPGRSGKVSAASSKRRGSRARTIGSRLLSLAAMLFAGAIVIGMSLPANAFYSTSTDSTNTLAASSSKAGQSVEVSNDEKVEVGTVVVLDRIAADKDGNIQLTPVLLVDGDTITHDAQALAKVTVTAQVVGDERGPKIVIQKFKNKTGYKKRQGFRADLTRVKITGIK